MHMARSAVVASAGAGAVVGNGSATGIVSDDGVAPLLIPRKKSTRMVPKKFIKCVIMVAVVQHYTLSMDKYEKVNLRIDEIVAEIQRLGRWSSGSLSPEKLENMGPFGMNTMPLEQWIQFVLVPRVQEIVEKKGEFPQSSISAYAVKYFDGDLDGQRLLQLIVEFDQIVNE